MDDIVQPTPSWRTDRRPHSAPTSPRLPTSARRCGRRTPPINGIAGPGRDGAPAMIPCRSQPDPHANPHTDANPDRVAQRHRRARRLDGRDHRAAGNHWTISSTNAVLENGKAAAFSANVAEIAYVSKTVWQENTVINGTAGPGQDGTPAMILWVSNPTPTPTPTPPNPTPLRRQPRPVAQRHRRARRLNGRDHRCRQQPLDDIVRQRRPGERKGGRIHRQRRRDRLRQ